MSFQILVKTVSGKTVVLGVNGQDKISYVKQKLEDTEGIPLQQQRLMFGYTQLKNNNTITSCNIQPDDTLDMLLRLHGGVMQMYVTPPIYHAYQKYYDLCFYSSVFFRSVFVCFFGVFTFVRINYWVSCKKS